MVKYILKLISNFKTQQSLKEHEKLIQKHKNSFDVEYLNKSIVITCYGVVVFKFKNTDTVEVINQKLLEFQSLYQ